VPATGVQADDLTVGLHSIIAVPCNDRRLEAAFLSFSEAFAYAREKRRARVQLSLSLPSMCDDRFPINGPSGQPFEMCNRIESARRGTPAANCGQPVLKSKINTVLGLRVAPRLECRNLRIDDDAVEVEEERGDHGAGTYTADLRRRVSPIPPS
jgi:hypothetical protein